MTFSLKVSHLKFAGTPGMIELENSSRFHAISSFLLGCFLNHFWSRKNDSATFWVIKMLSDSFNRVFTDITMFEINRKSLIQFCERSDIRLQCSWQKIIENAKNGQFWRVFSKNKIENFNLQARNKIIFWSKRHSVWKSRKMLHLFF